MAYKTIEVQWRDDILVVRVLESRIYLRVAEKFKEELIPLIEKDLSKLVVDLSKVGVMNSSGLGVLIQAREILDKRNCPVAVIGLRSLMKDVFLRMKLDLLFAICGSEEEALGIE